MRQSGNPLFSQVLIVIISALIFIPFLGGVHLFDWDEINFAESAREMIVTGDFLNVQIDYKVFWEKPPLFIWMQVLSMKIFGINEFAARFPNAICGIITLLVLFNIGRKLYDERFGWIWVMAYAGSVLPFFYFKSGIIDPWFNLFIFLGIYQFILFSGNENKGNKNYQIILSAIFIGLSVLTKGPVGFLIFALTVFVFLIFNRFKIEFSFYQVLLFGFFVSVVGGFWFILKILSGDYHIIVDFLQYQIRLFKTKDAGHGGFLLYHFVILFIGVFPASIIAIQSFRKENYSNVSQGIFKKWMIILLFVVLILFTIVKTKIIHYSSMCYFPISFLCTYVVYHIINKKKKLWLSTKILLVVVGLIYGGLQIGLSNIELYKDKIIASGKIDDPFAMGNLEAAANWQGFEYIFGVIFLIGIIVSIFFFRKRIKISFIVLFANTLLFTFFTLLFVAPRVEEYSQNAVIEFLKERENEDCYVVSLGHKSYAPYFYSKKGPVKNENYYNEQWLLKGDIDKKTYFILKNIREDYYLKVNFDIDILYRKNGFIFCLRNPE